MLPVAELPTSGWNPNRMSESEYADYIEDVRRLGKPPKPIVVTPDKPGYMIIDGEHGWRASKDVGLVEVPCEIVQVDPFEAMRQTLTRNRHGKNDPVLLGRLYERMEEERKLSNRALAKELHVAEGTIRIYLEYAKAAKARNSYAPHDADQRISRLSVRQVTAYLALPEDQRNEWLDSGASLEAAEQLKRQHAPADQGAATDQEVKAPVEGPEQDAAADHGRAESADEDDTALPTQEEADVAAAPAGRADVRTATSGPTSDGEPSFDQAVLDELEDVWSRTNVATRQKFLAGVLAEPILLAVARRILKQGS